MSNPPKGRGVDDALNKTPVLFDLIRYILQPTGSSTVAEPAISWVSDDTSIHKIKTNKLSEERTSIY